LLQFWATIPRWRSRAGRPITWLYSTTLLSQPWKEFAVMPMPWVPPVTV